MEEGKSLGREACGQDAVLMVLNSSLHVSSSHFQLHRLQQRKQRSDLHYP